MSIKEANESGCPLCAMSNKQVMELQRLAQANDWDQVEAMTTEHFEGRE